MSNCLCSQLAGFGDFLNFGDLMTGAQIKLSICFRKCVAKLTCKPRDVAHLEYSFVIFALFDRNGVVSCRCAMGLLILGYLLGLWAMKPRASSV